MARPINKIIGVCRFSYLGTGGFRASMDPPEDAAAMLYAPDRMQRRFAYFEHICLPSLAAQTDMDFALVVLVADTMPQNFRKRLKRLADRFAFLRLCILEAAGPMPATRRAFRRGLGGEAADFVTGFRIDDDDAVAVDYIARTRQVAETLIDQHWATPDTPAAICFHRGLYWDMARGADGFWDYSERQPLGLASAMVTTPDSPHNIYRWNHRKLAAKVRCWIDPSDVMFLRTLHGDNDSDRTVPPDAKAIGQPKARRLLRDRFALPPQRLIARMETLKARPSEATPQ